MITFILPGYSPHNKEWADQVAANLKVDGTIRPIYWDHWEGSEYGFKPKEKADLISRHAKGDKINIIAKSVGTLVASYIIDDIPGQINKVILCGVPSTSDKRLEIYRKSFSKINPDQIIVFQNTADPFAGYSEVKDFITKVSPKIKVFEKDRKDHQYPYFEDFNSYLTS